MHRVPRRTGSPPPTVDGVFAVKLPVADLDHSRAWYERVLGLVVELEFPSEDGVVTGVAGRLRGGSPTMLALREDPRLARELSGSNLVNWAVVDDAELHEWAAALTEAGVVHEGPLDATIGWMIVLHDPDGHELHLYSRQRHGLDHAGRTGFGRPVNP